MGKKECKAYMAEVKRIADTQPKFIYDEIAKLKKENEEITILDTEMIKELTTKIKTLESQLIACHNKNTELKGDVASIKHLDEKEVEKLVMKNTVHTKGEMRLVGTDFSRLVTAILNLSVGTVIAEGEYRFDVGRGRTVERTIDGKRIESILDKYNKKKLSIKIL